MALAKSEEELLQAFRLLDVLQRPVGQEVQGEGKLSKLFPRWLIVTNLLFILFCVLLELCSPAWVQRKSHLVNPQLTAYGTLVSLVFCLTHLLNGVRSSFVFSGYLVVLAVFGLVDHQDIVKGFARVGPWLPQLQFVIICGIQDSGILEFSLLRLLGKGNFPRMRLYWATLCLGAFVGATATITTATRVIIQWARSHDFQLRPLLLIMVVAATCGNSVFVTSSPSSMAIRDILCEAGGKDCGELQSQAFLALTNAAILGLWVEVIGDTLAKKDGRSPNTLRRTGFSDEFTDSADQVEEPSDALEPEVSLPYELDFALVAGSLICGHTPRSAGLCHLPGVQILLLCRRERTGLRRCEVLEDWVLETGDLITARCSADGVVAMRRFPGVFAMRGLHCHHALGGRRHERRLYESVVAEGSTIIGRCLEELLGLSNLTDVTETLAIPWCVPTFRGYPLAACRREAGALPRPLSMKEELRAGDVLLIDAFAEFPSLQTAQRFFLISGLVPRSRAPRHGRATDMWRGVMAVVGLIVALLLDLQRRCSILVSTMVVAGLLLITSGVKPSQISEVMDWNSCLTIGCGEGVALALRRSGLQWGLANAVIRIHAIGGVPLQLLVLSLTAQLAAACISSTPAGLLVANAALALDEAGANGLPSQQLLLLIVISCNMVLTVPMPDELMQGHKRAFSVRSLLYWSLPTSLLVAGLTACWTLMFELP